MFRVSPIAGVSHKSELIIRLDEEVLPNATIASSLREAVHLRVISSGQIIFQFFGPHLAQASHARLDSFSNFTTEKFMDIRAWRPGDEVAILDLFGIVFGKSMTESFWRWRYLDHPAGGPMIALVWDGDRLAAHYAASHAPLVIDGTPTKAALSMTTMTHPDYRGQGLFERSASVLYDQISAVGVEVVWGFPNRNSNVPFRRKLNWDAIADIPVLTCDLRTVPSHKSSELVEVPAIDPRFDLVAGNTEGWRGDHRASYLAWRIDRNPVNTYIILTLPASAGLDGYAILKPYGAADLDLVALAATDDRAFPQLISGVLAAAASRGAQRVNCWSLPQDPTRLPLERAGFQATAPVTYFGARGLGGSQLRLDDARRWRIAMLDSDIY